MICQGGQGALSSKLRLWFVLEALGHLPCAFLSQFGLTSDYCYTPLGGPEKVGAIISVMVSSPEMDRKCDQKGQKSTFSKGVMLYIVGKEISRR